MIIWNIRDLLGPDKQDIFHFIQSDPDVFLGLNGAYKNHCFVLVVQRYFSQQLEIGAIIDAARKTYDRSMYTLDIRWLWQLFDDYFIE